MADITKKCKDCGKDFIFTEKDQEFFKEMKFVEPKRCHACRRLKNVQKY